MKFTQTHREGGDCTAPYDVTEFPEIVADFVCEVLGKYKGEWGDFDFYEGDRFIRRIEYKYGQLIDNIPSDILTKRIKEIKGVGGWTWMRYSINLY